MHTTRPNRLAIATVLASLVSACTSTHVTSMDPARNPDPMICIVQNPEVTVDGFLSIVQQEFQRHGIRTSAYAGSALPATCD